MQIGYCPFRAVAYFLRIFLYASYCSKVTSCNLKGVCQLDVNYYSDSLLNVMISEFDSAIGIIHPHRILF